MSSAEEAPGPCPGCGLVAEPAAGPTHAYIGASPGCWARYGELIASGGGGQLAVDTYAVQHPGVPERRAIQSVCLHLVGLCAVLERGWPRSRGPELLRRALARPQGWRWLDPDLPLGTVTVAEVGAAQEREAAVRAWAEDLWAAYAVHQPLVRGWTDAVLAGG